MLQTAKTNEIVFNNIEIKRGLFGKNILRLLVKCSQGYRFFFLNSILYYQNKEIKYIKYISDREEG